MKHVLLSILLTVAQASLSLNQETYPEAEIKRIIAQLLVVPVIPSRDERLRSTEAYQSNYCTRHISELMQSHGISTLIILGTCTAEQQRASLEQLSSASSIPLIIAQDLEWGPGMRVTDRESFPKAMTLGATNNLELIKEVGYAVGRGTRLLGVDINFAPVVDLNTNPNNPIIGMRSFGDNPDRVARQAKAFIDGLHEAGVICCIKHFPGHGDTHTDSHSSLPYLDHSLERLESVELYPFKQLLTSTDLVMIGHLAVPALDQSKTPSSLSHAIVTDLLKHRLGYTGCVCTDALDMKAVSKRFDQPGIVEQAAMISGNDLIVCPCHVPEAIEKIYQAVRSGQLDINALMSKYEQLQRLRTIKATRPSLDQLPPVDHTELISRAFQAALTPYGISAEQLNNYHSFTIIAPRSCMNLVPSGYSARCLEEMNPEDMDRSCSYIFLLTQSSEEMIPELAAYSAECEKRGIASLVLLAGSPYLLKQLPQQIRALIAYEEHPLAVHVALKSLTDKLPITGSLPVRL